VGQIAQHRDNAPVKTSKLCLRCPNFDHPQTSETHLLEGQYQTPNEPHARENEHNDNQRKDVEWFQAYYKNIKLYFHSNSFLLDYLLLK
jgi:hypothetical protein